MYSKLEEQFICKKCGKTFEATIYTSVNVTERPELRPEVLSGRIFKHKCPHCHEEIMYPTPLCYSDNENQFMVFLNDYLELENLKDNLREKNSIYNNFSGLLKNFQIAGVTNFNSLVEAICIIENKLDYRVTKLFIKIVEEQFVETRKKEGFEDKIIDSLFMYDESDNILISIIAEGDNGNDIYMIPFSEYKDYYDNIYKHYYDDLYKIDSLIFDRNTAKKFIDYAEADDEIKKCKLQLALCECDDGRQIYANIADYNFDKYKEGDIICVRDNEVFLKVIVRKIISSKLEELFLDPTEIARIMWRCKDVKLISTGDAEDELDNSELLKALKNFDVKNDLKYFPDELIMTSDVMVDEVSNIVGPELNLKANETKSNFIIKAHMGKKYLCVYLEKKNIHNNVGKYKAYLFNDIVEVVINNPNLFDGLLINPHDDGILIELNTLSYYKSNRYMTNPKRMIKLLEKLTKEEIEYMTEDCYDIICKVYYEDKVPKEIAVELSKPESEIHKLLDEGYKAMISIVEENY